MKIKKYLFVSLIIIFSVGLFYSNESKKNKIVPEFRLITDFWSYPFYYEFENEMYGISFNGSIMAGVRLKQFTIGTEIFEHYNTINSINDPDNYKGAWNILRGALVGFYEPVKWFELKLGLGGAWFNSAFTNEEVGTVGNSEGGFSILLDGAFRPWKYLQLKLINRLDLFFSDTSTNPYYFGGIRCDFHPYFEWLNLYIEAGVMTWINRDELLLNVNTAILVWGVGASIDITPVRLVKKSKGKKRIEKKEEKREEVKSEESIKEFKEAEEVEIIQFPSIIFFPNSDKIKKEYYIALDEIVRILNERKSINVEIRGHTNDLKNLKGELKLSKKRAEKVKRYLASKGIDQKRMKTIGFGSKYTKGKSIDESNRKVEIKIIEE